MPRNQRRKRGFSVLEVTVAIAIGSIVFLFLLQLIQTATKGGKRIGTKLDFDNSGVLITQLLGSPSNCQAYFSNQTFLSDPTGLSAQVIGATGTPLFIHMPNDTSKVVVKPGEILTGTIKTDALVIRDLVLQTTDSYLGKVHFEAHDTSVQSLPMVRDFPITITTQDVPASSPAQKRIVACVGSGAPAGGGSGAAYSVIARHSMTTTAPACPAGWESLWTGYSFAGGAAHMDNASIDLGTSGSCLESFNPLPFFTCQQNDLKCDYSAHSELSMWLTTTSAVPNTNYDGAGNPSLILPYISRCRVCAKSTPVLVRHSMTGTAPSCPTGWTSVWTGYSFGGATVEGHAWVNNLHSPGSCLENFLAVPVIECNRGFADSDDCNYLKAGDTGLWITGYFNSPGDTTNMGGATLLGNISRCNVCER